MTAPASVGFLAVTATGRETGFWIAFERPALPRFRHPESYMAGG